MDKNDKKEVRKITNRRFFSMADFDIFDHFLTPKSEFFNLSLPNLSTQHFTYTIIILLKVILEINLSP
jgi:hypothetical protein